MTPTRRPATGRGYPGGGRRRWRGPVGRPVRATPALRPGDRLPRAAGRRLVGPEGRRGGGEPHPRCPTRQAVMGYGPGPNLSTCRHGHLSTHRRVGLSTARAAGSEGGDEVGELRGVAAL